MATRQNPTDSFKYCFPADPAVVVGEYNNHLSVLRAIYASDVYGNIFRVDYTYDNKDENGDAISPWSWHQVFATNPDSLATSGSLTLRNGSDEDSVWRKVFYSPAVSWQGSGYYFDNGNYSHPDNVVENTDKIASLFFGTGDRVHPTYNIASDRIYAVYDDTPVTAYNTSTNATVQVSSAPYYEEDLLNLTCDELDTDTVRSDLSEADTLVYKTELRTLLTDDVLNEDSSDPMELASGGKGENDAKGWYIVLAKQGDDDYCSHCSYNGDLDNDTTEGRDSHYGEKVFSRLTLYAGGLYLSTYQPNFDDPCEPAGNSFSYAISYLNGSALWNLNLGNDYNSDGSSSTVAKKDITDRYVKVSNIKALPATLTPVYRKGETHLPTPALKDLDISEKERPIYYWLEK